MQRTPKPPQARWSASALGECTSLISDAMDELGIPDGVIGASVLKPTMPGKLVVGPALTVRNIAAARRSVRGARGARQQDGRVRGAQPREAGDVLVIARRRRRVQHGRHLGADRQAPGRGRRDRHGRRARRARIRARSAIRCGRARSRRSPASGGSRRSRSTATIQIGGVRVAPGDLVVADDTGVCFIPRADILRCWSCARRRSEAEDARIEAIEKGVPVPVFTARAEKQS